MPGIFISYRRKDAGGYAGHLHQDLVQRYGRDEVFMDIDSIHGGVDFRKRIHDALDASDIALILIGEDWTATSTSPGGEVEGRRIDEEEDLVRREVAAALRHEEVTVIPILVDGARVPDAADLPTDLASLPDLQVCRLRNSEWRSDVDRICRAIDTREPWVRRALRGAQTIARRPIAAGAAVLALAAIAAYALLSGVSPNPDEGCKNPTIPPEKRARLSDAAGTSDPAKYGVYYGTCGSRAWAIAEFPEVESSVFVEDGFSWRMLGPTPAYKCTQIPAELLDEWRQNDC